MLFADTKERGSVSYHRDVLVRGTRVISTTLSNRIKSIWASEGEFAITASLEIKIGDYTGSHT